MSRRFIKGLVRLLVSGLLIAVLVSFLDIRQTTKILVNIDLTMLVIPTGLLFFQTGISAYKWKLILEADGIRIGFFYLLKTYLISQFISLFLPSSIGGDVYRVAAIKRVVKHFSLRFSSVIFDRATGLYGLLIVAVAGSFALLHHLFTLYIFGFLLAIPLVFLAVTHSTILEKMQNSDLRVIKLIGELMASQRRIVFSWRFIPVMAISVLFHAGVVVITAFYCAALGLGIRFEELWAIVPLVAITDMIPLSINGIGIRDSAYVFFFTLLEHSAESAFALSLLIVAMRYCYGMVGGVLLFLDMISHKAVVRPSELRE